MTKPWLDRGLVALLAAGTCLAASAATVGSTPAAPGYGDAVQIQLLDGAGPQYLPGMRFVRSGNAIVVDYEYVRDGFGPIGPDFGFSPIAVGELVPGYYTLQARLFDIGGATAPAQLVVGSFAVSVAPNWGIYLVPSVPAAWEAVDILLHSAAYFDPSTLRISRAGNVIRVDFDFASDAPVGGAAPADYVAYASVAIDPLAPGAYRIEAYGRDTLLRTTQKYFAIDALIPTTMPVIEYYNEHLDHYFLGGGPDEVALLDAGAGGGWKRTGQKLKGWLHQAEAPSNAEPVCRFYALGPNSHFFTADASECQSLKVLEQSQRARAVASGSAFLGWSYEGIGFWALVPINGQCPGGSDPVYRSYNDRAAQNDSNHRFTRGGPVHQSMTVSWIDEGVQLCSPV